MTADAELKSEDSDNSEDEFERKMKDRHVKKEQEKNKHFVTEVGNLGTLDEEIENKNEASETLFGFVVDTLTLIFQVRKFQKYSVLNQILAILHFIDVDFL